jgi:hypothetical protein
MVLIKTTGIYITIETKVHIRIRRIANMLAGAIRSILIITSDLIQRNSRVLFLVIFIVYKIFLDPEKESQSSVCNTIQKRNFSKEDDYGTHLKFFLL